MAQIPTFRSFVSEKEIEEVKKKRQEEWERVRRPDQPLQRPEEEYDHRTLYERLKAQKDKKQEEWEEQFKFKNMIYKGLDDDESRFLNFVADQQAEHDAVKMRQEMEDLSEYREAVARLQEDVPSTTASTPNDRSSSTEDSTRSPTEKLTSPKLGSVSTAGKTRKSQLSLLAGSIKTKRKRSASQEREKTSAEPTPSPDKRPRLDPDNKTTEIPTQHEEAVTNTPAPSGLVAVSTTAKLPGLAAYSSSESESEGESPTDTSPQ